MTFRTRLAAVGGSALLALAAGCASVPTPPATVAEAIGRDPQLSTLNQLVVQAGLADTLRGAGPFTVFAPTDEAFRAVPPQTLAELAADKAKLQALLGYHVLPGAVTAERVKTGNVKTVQGASLALAKAGSFVTADEALVTQADRRAGNGVVHLVDRVLMPPKR